MGAFSYKDTSWHAEVQESVLHLSENQANENVT
jgi:hypothetical protein